MDPEDADEITDAEMVLWLKTPEGLATMQQIMLDVKAGRYGEMTQEVLQAAEQGLAWRETPSSCFAVSRRRRTLASVS